MMLSMLPRLILPDEVVIKKGSLIRLRYLIGRQATIVCGKESLRRSGGLEKISSYISQAKMEVSIIDGIYDDPTAETIQEVGKRLSGSKPDWIIACGGGSVIDSAKLGWAFYEHPELKISEMTKPFTLPELRSKARLVAIPTTSGTGSEVSNAAVIKDETARVKVSIVSAEFIPDLVILDAALTTQLPAKITAATGLDAFSHAAESFCSTINNHLTNSLAIMAARMIVENISIALSEPGDLDVREKLQYAAMFAGMAQNMTSVGAVHALSHTMGAQADLAHGVGNAIFLSAVLGYNAELSPRPAIFAESIGFSSLDKMIEWISSIIKSAGLPSGWGQVLAPGSTVDVQQLASSAFEDICLRTNPRKMGKEDLLAILEETR